jgi:hypothetical protein
MKPFNRYVLRPVLAGVVLCAASLSAYAQSTRTWVSSTGNDANAWSRAAPCATFGGAYNKTTAGGVINVIDAGAYAGVNISKSITIEGAAGSQNGVLASGGSNGFVINGSGINVVLRNLQITGAPPSSAGFNGVKIINAAMVTIDNCDISDFKAASTGNANGVLIDVPSDGVFRVLIINSRIHDNGFGNDGGGVRVRPTGANGYVFATIRDSQIFNNNGYGVQSRDRSYVTISRSGIIGNNRSGVNTITTGALAESIITDSTLIDNGYGNASADAAITSNGASSVVSISGNNIVQNETGVRRLNGGHIRSSGNNRVAGNTVDGTTDGAVTSL